ncbi:MAG: Hint domain-containing protein [Pseudomonadota bacterium]
MEPKTVSRRSDGPVLALRAKLSGFCEGTPIVTRDGLLPIEHLHIGDKLVTRRAGLQALAWIEALFVTTFAVAVAPGAMGAGKPESEIMLPEGQRFLIRDWRAEALYGGQAVGVPAWRLADGTSLRRLGPRTMRIFRLGFERQEVIYSGGLQLLAQTKRFTVPQPRSRAERAAASPASLRR